MMGSSLQSEDYGLILTYPDAYPEYLIYTIGKVYKQGGH